jgi:hypothetical protein
LSNAFEGKLFFFIDAHRGGKGGEKLALPPKFQKKLAL